MQQPLLNRNTKSPVAESAMTRLAEREQFPQPLRDVLQGLLPLCDSGLGLRIAESMTEFEKQLVRLADKAPNEQQNGYFDSVHEIKRGRADVMPRFLRSIENSLAHLGEEVMPASGAPKPSPMKLRLALTESAHLDESLVLSDIATKVELRVREPLFGLGSRFGVLAGTQRIAVESMPLGPRCLLEALRYATSELDLVLEHRLLLYRCFEGVVLIGIASFYQTLNDYLIEQGILRDLCNLSSNARPDISASYVASERWAGGSRTGANQSSAARSTDSRLIARQPRQPSQPSELFGTLRQLLGECRRAETYTASCEDMQGVLAALQARQAEPVSVEDKQALYSSEQIKQEVLAVLRELSADGRAPRISDEDIDTIDLIATLFEFLSRRARSDGLTHWILITLQMPILRVAFSDKGFFSNTQHPARQVLSQILEFSRFWVDEIEAQDDPVLVNKLQRIANRIASQYQGDIAVFTQALQELSEHSEAIVRTVELAEGRHVATARGRERLELSRSQATAAVSERIARTKPNGFVRTLLEQAWIDVLVVSRLRDDESGVNYTRQLAVVDQLLAYASGSQSEHDSSSCSGLSAQVQAGLAQVGLHDDDVQAIVRTLFGMSAGSPQEDPISQTELAFKLKDKIKLGSARKVDSIRTPYEPAQAPLRPDEQAALDRISTLPPGTWFEFVINEEGDTVRRKLSWYSKLTGRCLFINQRGVPTEEQTIEELARAMVRGQARVARGEQESLLDRASSAIIDTLKYFSTHKPDNYFGAPTLADRALDIHRQRIAAREVTPKTKEVRTLLLVDDEENILRALTRLLRSDGYQILTCTSARDGLELLRQHEVQVIVSDQRMPGMSGTEFLSDVKRTHPSTTRIVLSGYSDAAAVTDAINRGTISKFLTKPWDDEDIRQEIRNAFGAHESRPEQRTCATSA